MYTFLLADDHSIVRTGIRELIKENFSFRIIEEARNSGEVVAMVKKNHYDLIMLDINMPDTDSLSLLTWIKTMAPLSNILIFTTHSEQIYGVRTMQAGASGFLNKSATNNEIIAAIRRVLDNKKYISPELVDLLLQNNSGDKPSNPFTNLSTREMEITMLLHQGKNLTEICSLLSIQYSTGNTYKRRIFEKLNVFNMVSLERLIQTFGIE